MTIPPSEFCYQSEPHCATCVHLVDSLVLYLFFSWPTDNHLALVLGSRDLERERALAVNS